jgi:hypothetical protein
MQLSVSLSEGAAAYRSLLYAVRPGRLTSHTCRACAYARMQSAVAAEHTV